MDERYSNTQLKLLTGSHSEQQVSKEWKELRRGRLINSLNRINFQDGDIVLNFRHLKYDTLVSIPAKPQPCLDHYFECTWSEPIDIDNKVNHYKFENFYFTDGLKQFLVEAELVSINRNGVTFCLPENAVVVNSRKVRRHKCTDVSLQLFQNGLIFEGELATFSPASFSVNIPDKISFNNQQEIKREEPVEILLIKDKNILFAGKCEIFRLTDTTEGKTLILNPLNTRIQRFKSKEFRSIRQKLNPSPNIIFYHPFIGKRINLKIRNISGSGFSVEETFENSLLLPGMIIPELHIELVTGLELKCKCQGIYRTSLDGDTVKCGFAFIDMSLKDQITLTSFLHQASNKNAHVCTKVNIDELWNFFFESGFVYPKKYFYIHSNRNKFDEVYTKLYEHESDIAINFIYQDKGRIYGHMSMFRFYDKTWIINHHAADSSKRSRAGLVVLEQIGRYINEFHRLPSTKMKYVGCYFRPENKFPNLVFGGAARNSSAGCTVDQFAYMHLSKKQFNYDIPENWTLFPTSNDDLAELKNQYETKYGGLSLKALDIEPSRINHDKKINDEFLFYGFKRERLLFALKDQGNLVAVIMLSVSELGLNMSDLTNCFHVFVLDPDRLPSKILYSTLTRLSSHYEHDNLSVLIFPKEYAEIHTVPIDKTYNFWVLDVEKSSDEYFTHVEKILCRSKRERVI
ncbi:MAG: hypothetical protein AMJ60_00550 [Desulfobacterales bacterium SG8_35]|nr:MAG: hypothetical protein AMJ60_00550 [Desulfobacterales bacterium SG8_35]